MLVTIIKKFLLQKIAEAIVSVAEEEWLRLAGRRFNRVRHVYAARSLEDSLRSFRDLQIGTMPDYSEWDALAYGTWFQPKQINLVYDTLRAMKIHLARKDSITWDGDIFALAGGESRVIDFGCGALATQFAVALAARESILNGVRVSDIQIDSIDSSPAMIYFGQRIWEEFVRTVKLNHPDDVICDVFDVVNARTHTSVDSVPVRNADSCFVTAIHASYESTARGAKADLSKLVSRFSPIGVVLTTHWGKRRVLSKMIPSKCSSHYIRSSVIPPKGNHEGDGSLEVVTNWRVKKLKKLMARRELLKEAGVNVGFMSSYLRGEVDWNYPPMALRVYVSQDFENSDSSDLPW